MVGTSGKVDGLWRSWRIGCWFRWLLILNYGIPGSCRESMLKRKKPHFQRSMRVDVMNYRLVFEINPEKVELYEKSDTYTIKAILELLLAVAGCVTLKPADKS
jgi:hypothetical protein